MGNTTHYPQEWIALTIVEGGLVHGELSVRLVPRVGDHLRWNGLRYRVGMVEWHYGETIRVVAAVVPVA